MKGNGWKSLGFVFLALALVVGGPAGLARTADAAGHQKGNPCAARNPCAASANPCNPCAAKGNPCNPCAAKGANPCNPCAAGGARAPRVKARMIIGTVLFAKAGRVAVRWKGRTLNIGVHAKTQYSRGPGKSSLGSIRAGERIIVSMLDRGGKLTANYVYLSKAGRGGGNPCNPCAAKGNPCNPCAAKANPCAAKGNPCNPCAAKKANPCAAKANPCNPCAAKK